MSEQSFPVKTYVVKLSATVSGLLCIKAVNPEQAKTLAIEKCINQMPTIVGGAGTVHVENVRLKGLL